jgi:hypothetical protein
MGAHEIRRVRRPSTPKRALRKISSKIGQLFRQEACLLRSRMSSDTLLQNLLGECFYGFV